MRKWFIEDPIYNKGFYLIVGGGEISDIEKKIDKWTGEIGDWDLKDNLKDNLKGAFLILKGKKIYHFLWLKSFEWTIEEQGIFVHELNHLCNETFKSCQLEDREEAYAYYFEMLFIKCYEKLKTLNMSYKKKPKKKK